MENIRFKVLRLLFFDKERRFLATTTTSRNIFAAVHLVDGIQHNGGIVSLGNQPFQITFQFGSLFIQSK